MQDLLLRGAAYKLVSRLYQDLELTISEWSLLFLSRHFDLQRIKYLDQLFIGASIWPPEQAGTYAQRYTQSC